METADPAATGATPVDTPGSASEPRPESDQKAADAPPEPAATTAGPRQLDPATLCLQRAPSGELRLSLEDVTHLRASVYRAFPLSAPDAWVVFFDGGGAHVGIVEDVGALDGASAALCRQELELRYVVPVAREIAGIREEYSDHEWNPAQIWDIDTDRGPLRLHLPNLADHVRAVGEGRLLLTDRDERRCLLRPGDLGPRSRSLLGRYLWLDGLE